MRIPKINLIRIISQRCHLVQVLRSVAEGAATTVACDKCSEMVILTCYLCCRCCLFLYFTTLKQLASLLEGENEYYNQQCFITKSVVSTKRDFGQNEIFFKCYNSGVFMKVLYIDM